MSQSSNSLNLSLSPFIWIVILGKRALTRKMVEFWMKSFYCKLFFVLLLVIVLKSLFFSMLKIFFYIIVLLKYYYLYIFIYITLFLILFQRLIHIFSKVMLDTSLHFACIREKYTLCLLNMHELQFSHEYQIKICRIISS